MTGFGLTRVSTPDLVALRAHIARPDVRFPLTEAELLAAGFHAIAQDVLTVFVGIDRLGVARVLAIALAEREHRAPPHLDLVWTGPEPRVATTRDTVILVRELFEQARSTALIAGFAFDHGDEIFAPLHESMRAHGVTTDIFLDIRDPAPDGADVAAHARDYVDRFLGRNWPFGPPFPTVYYDPRSAEPGSRASLHAKCIVVDRARTLITSANFTDRAQARNVELGVVVDDAEFAGRVTAQWQGLVEADLMVAVDRAARP